MSELKPLTLARALLVCFVPLKFRRDGMMRLHWIGLLAVFALVMGAGDAQARYRKHLVPEQPPIVVVHIAISNQSMNVNVNGWPSGSWQVSTAGARYHTPRGTFRVQRMAKMWFSRKYDNSPMPNSLFFDGGIAIHGTNHLRSIGHPMSHGCVRLLPENAARLYAIVEEYGPSRTQIVVTD